jgi:thiamine pyrophosphate-dependent acetolactate synthase large subunit-like protein
MAELEEVTKKAHAEKGPVLVEYIVQPEDNVYPIIPPGAGIADTMGREEISSLKKLNTGDAPG